METKNKYILISDLEVYRLSRQLSEIAWDIYQKLNWQTKKIIGDQFIESTDSVGANIAEGYQRYHYLDKIKFYYQARGSLSESADHWLELLKDRQLTDQATYSKFKTITNSLSLKLNNFIRGTYQAKKSQ